MIAAPIKCVPLSIPERILIDTSYRSAANWWYNHSKAKHNKTVSKNVLSWVENECCCPRRVNISYVNFITRYLYHHSQYSTTWDSKWMALAAHMVRAFGNRSLRVRAPLRSRHLIFCLKNFDTFTRTCFCESKMNAVAWLTGRLEILP